MIHKNFTTEDINNVLLYMEISDYVIHSEITNNFVENIIKAWFCSQGLAKEQIEYYDYLINPEDEVELYYTLKNNE